MGYIQRNFIAFYRDFIYFHKTSSMCSLKSAISGCLSTVAFSATSIGNYIAGRSLTQRKDVSLCSGSNFCLVYYFNCHNILRQELHSLD
jgi:hypothetical protein